MAQVLDSMVLDSTLTPAVAVILQTFTSHGLQLLRASGLLCLQDHSSRGTFQITSVLEARRVLAHLHCTSLVHVSEDHRLSLVKRGSQAQEVFCATGPSMHVYTEVVVPLCAVG